MDRRKFMASVLAFPAAVKTIEAAPAMEPIEVKQPALQVSWMDNKNSFIKDWLVFEKGNQRVEFQFESLSGLVDTHGLNATMELAVIIEQQLKYGPIFDLTDKQLSEPKVEISRFEHYLIVIILSDFRHRGLTFKKLFSNPTKYYRGIASITLRDYYNKRAELLGPESLSIRAV